MSIQKRSDAATATPSGIPVAVSSLRRAFALHLDAPTAIHPLLVATIGLSPMAHVFFIAYEEHETYRMINGDNFGPAAARRT